MLNDYRRTIQILEKVVTRDEFGSETISYSELYTLRAGVKDFGGSKGVDAEEIFSSEILVFETHYRPLIATDMLVVYNEKRYRINHIAEIGFHQGLEISAELINE